MAEVFRAQTFGVHGFQRLLVIKRILPHLSKDEEFVDMFIDEAKIAVGLNPRQYLPSHRSWENRRQLLHCHGVCQRKRFASHI
jgi:hypothetical protein